MKGKYQALFLLFLLIFIGSSSAYLFLPDYFQSLDSRIRDFYFKVRGPEKTSENIVIIDIDEKSIAKLGQWPWERDKVAKILDNLNSLGAGIIGLDIVFSEADKTSPNRVAKAWQLKADNLPDYDEVFATTIQRTPTILGFVFRFKAKNEIEAPQIPAIFVQKHKKRDYLPQAYGVLPNLPILQNASYSSGYMNNIPDDSGIIRSVPMLVSYDMEVYPSLAFEMYRIATASSKVVINYSEVGIDNIKLENETIMCDRFGKMYLNFRGPFQSYKYISAVDVYYGNIDQAEIEGKFVLLGTSANGLKDLRATPMDSVIAGVEIHANIIDNLLNKDMLYRPNWDLFIDIFMIFLASSVVIFYFSRLSLALLIPVYSFSFFSLLYFNYYMLFTQHVILNTIFPLFSLFISLIGVLGINYMFETRQKELIKGSFSKKVSKQVMDDLLINPDANAFNSKEVNATIYFSDIRSFTTISETLHSPKRITDFLNFYMNAMVEPIEKTRGTVDKFIGDAVMAYWNAPLKVEAHADKAVTTALKQVAMRDELNETINKEFGFDVDYGIGINTGDVVVGEIGSYGRSDYTIIGDAVNLASRLEGLCKPYKVRLIISEFTKEVLLGSYVTQLLDIVKVKGKHEPVKIYEVLSLGEATQKQIDELILYEQAHTLYMKAEFIAAMELFDSLYARYNKYLYDMYAKRCKHLIDENIDEFDGIFEFTTK